MILKLETCWNRHPDDNSESESVGRKNKEMSMAYRSKSWVEMECLSHLIRKEGPVRRKYLVRRAGASDRSPAASHSGSTWNKKEIQEGGFQTGEHLEYELVSCVSQPLVLRRKPGEPSRSGHRRVLGSTCGPSELLRVHLGMPGAQPCQQLFQPRPGRQPPRHGRWMGGGAELCGPEGPSSFSLSPPLFHQGAA